MVYVALLAGNERLTCALADIRELIVRVYEATIRTFSGDSIAYIKYFSSQIYVFTAGRQLYRLVDPITDSVYQHI